METPQKKSSNKWLIGLGIGCGGAVVLIIIVGIAGYFFVRNVTQGFRDSQGLLKSLEEKYGRAEAYVPNPGGAISPARLEVFLAVREATAAARKNLEASLETLSKSRAARDAGGKPSRNVFSSLRAGLGMVPQLSEFLKGRGQALMDKEMGMGEYYYIYVVAYYSWLKKSPEDGPGLQTVGPGFDRTDPDDRDAVEMSRDVTLRRVHRAVLPMLENQLAKLRAAPGSGGGQSRDKWAEALSAEVKAMETDRFRIPWQDGAPEVIDKSLRPLRERFEAAYSRLTNIFELITEQR
jgi:hypothetical protein